MISFKADQDIVCRECGKRLYYLPQGTQMNLTDYDRCPWCKATIIE